MKQIQVIHQKKVIEQVIDALKDYILKGDINIGDQMPTEMELCRQMGIGRGTLREAVKILEFQGFVKKVHGVGVIVVDESFQATSEMLKLVLFRNGMTMKDLWEFRKVNEIRTAELAAANATEEDVKEIEKHLVEMRNNLSNPEQYLVADVAFHYAIAVAARNKLLAMILQIIRPLIEDMIKQVLSYNVPPSRSMKFHSRIFTAVQSKDPVNAALMMKKHLDDTKITLNYAGNIKSLKYHK